MKAGVADKVYLDSVKPDIAALSHRFAPDVPCFPATASKMAV